MAQRAPIKKDVLRGVGAALDAIEKEKLGPPEIVGTAAELLTRIGVALLRNAGSVMAFENNKATLLAIIGEIKGVIEKEQFGLKEIEA